MYFNIPYLTKNIKCRLPQRKHFQKTVCVIFQKENTNLFLHLSPQMTARGQVLQEKGGFSANVAMFIPGQPVSNAIMAKCQALSMCKMSLVLLESSSRCRLPAPTLPRCRGAADRDPPPPRRNLVYFRA